MAMRDRLKRVYLRHRALRELSALAVRLSGRRDFADLAHLALYRRWSWGPVQPEEALLLHSLVRTLRPATVVEIGFLYGHGAFNLLTAMDAEARLYSFDIDPSCAARARELSHDKRFTFRLRSQDEITSADIDGRPVDFLFLDGAHEIDTNRRAFRAVLPLLAPNAIVAVHDTGAIPRHLTPDGHWTLAVTQRWVDGEYEHQPDERGFVNSLLDAHPEFSQIHLHSRRAFRHGITLLQKNGPLPRPRTAGSKSK